MIQKQKQISFPVDEPLHQRIKIRAIVEKMDLKDWIIRILTREINKGMKNAKII